MSQAVDDLLASADEPRPPSGPPRNGNGQYLLPDTDGTQKAWVRATTIAGTIKDGYKIGQWAERMVGVGVAKRRDLQVAIATLDPDDDKGAIQDLCDTAKEVAGSSVGSRTGTALHTATEIIDAGGSVTLPAPFHADLLAYRAELDRLGIAVVDGMIECVVTLDGLDECVAGTFDRLVTLPPAARCPCHDEPFELPLVGDLKTGQQIFDFGEIAVQLALYAHADRMHDWRTKTHRPMPVVDQRHALVFHLPSGQAACTVYVVDIEAGWEGVQLAMAVRKFRRFKGATQLAPAVNGSTVGRDGVGGGGDADPIPATPAPDPTPLDPERLAAANENLRDRLRRCLDANGGALPLGLRWPEQVRTLRDGGPQTAAGFELAHAFVIDVERRLGMEFQPVPGSLHVEAPEGADAEVLELPVDHGALAVELLAPFAADEQRALVLACTGGQAAEPARFTASMLERLRLLLDAMEAGWLMWSYAEGDSNEVHTSLAIAPAGDLALDAAYASRSELLAAAKTAAEALGRPKPRSAAQACTDPLLVAALATGNTATGDTDDR